jgi:putative addiction module component (TIGR02574 family)
MISIQEIDKLTVAEKFELMEQIWASLCNNNPDYESPAWHGEELERRRQKKMSGETKYSDLESVKKRLLELEE